jgi:hypothetical protein
MRQNRGLEVLTKEHAGRLTVAALSDLLQHDLKNCECLIFGQTEEEEPVLLAILHIIPDSLYYESFDQRIDFTVVGDIISDQYVPLTYRVQGEYYYFYGRCSTIPKVCGVDLYLSQSYTEKAGDRVQQRFSIFVKKLMKGFVGV